MIKIVEGGVAYYFRNSVQGSLALNKRGLDRTWLLQHADIAVNLKTNEVIKCRSTLEGIFDKSFGVC